MKLLMSYTAGTIAIAKLVISPMESSEARSFALFSEIFSD